MFSIMNVLRTILSMLLSLLYSIGCSITAGPSTDSKLPVTPDDFTPVVRFAVCSDVHIDPEEENQAEPERFRAMINTVYDYAETCEYKNVDAVCVAGDFTNHGRKAEYEVFNQVANETIREGTQLLTSIGNHEFIEYRDEDASVGIDVYEEMMDRNVNEHYVINGYHFIMAGYAEDGKSFTSRIGWMNKEISSAIADTGDKPVFVFQHPAPFGTVYGSVSWGDPTVSAVLSAYPQVIDFSGHSHYPVNDPRSIWQGTFTALGCGTLSYFETDLDGISGNFPYDVSQAAQFYIVEADAKGNVCIKSYDLITNTFFDNEYYLTDLADKNYEYSYSNMKRRDSAPVFPADTEISTYLDDDGNTILKFTGAKDNFVVESYKVSVTKLGVIPVASDNFSGKYMYQFMEDEYTVNLGKLDKGTKYTAQIVALNAYAQTSEPLNYSFVG